MVELLFIFFTIYLANKIYNCAKYCVVCANIINSAGYCAKNGVTQQV